jgi:ABC-type branched-subunit amino acid transport system substrate-binding protein
MKKIFVFLILAVAAYGIYQYVGAGIRYSSLENAVIADIADAATTPTKQIQTAILKNAEAMGVPLHPENLAVTIEDTGEKGLAGQMLSGAGMRVQSKVIKVRLSYEEHVLGIPRHYSMERQHTYTVSAAPPPAPEPYLESPPES